jgi:hypothetical protein
VLLFEAVCQKDLEGIVGKHRLAPYSAKPQNWFEILNPDYTQKRGRREMFDKFRERPTRPAVNCNQTAQSLRWPSRMERAAK